MTEGHDKTKISNPTLGVRLVDNFGILQIERNRNSVSPRKLNTNRQSNK